MAIEYIDRPPRIQPELPIREVEIPKPPDPKNQNSSGQVLTTLMPLISVVGFLVASGTGAIAFVLPMALAVVASIALALYQRAKDKQDQAAKEKAYAELLLQMRQEMTQAHTSQRIFYQYNYPDNDTLISIAARKENSRFGPRIWERRPTDLDFCAVRLGSGSRPSTVIYKIGDSASAPTEGRSVSLF